MSKKYHCANCGIELKVVRKAIPHKRMIMNFVEPHTCDIEEGVKKLEEFKKADKKTNVDKFFDDFLFVSKLNKATAEHEDVIKESGDKRDKKHLREELVTSSAPLNILDRVASSINTTPAHDTMEEPEDVEHRED